MQNTELSHLYKSFKSIFPTAHIVIIDHTGSVIMACENRCLIPQTEQYSGFKEILTVHAPTGGTFYKLSFPLRCQISCSSIYPPRILKMF